MRKVDEEFRPPPASPSVRALYSSHQRYYTHFITPLQSSIFNVGAAYGFPTSDARSYRALSVCGKYGRNDVDTNARRPWRLAPAQQWRRSRFEMVRVKVKLTIQLSSTVVFERKKKKNSRILHAPLAIRMVVGETTSVAYLRGETRVFGFPPPP